MPACLRCTRSILALGLLALVACISVGGGKVSGRPHKTKPLSISRPGAVTVLGGATLALVARSTLEHFWNLASLQVRDPATSSRLLATDPREPAKTLKPLGIDSQAYQEQLAKAGVRSLILFLPHGADPVEEARRRGFAIAPWPPSAPPALLSGPEVDTLILFQPLTSTSEEPGPVIRTRIASLAGLAGIFPALSIPDDPIDPRYYRVLRVLPRDGKKTVSFEHTRCRYAGAELREGSVLITTLTYKGGVTKEMRTPLSKQNWQPCRLKSGVPGVSVQQPSLDKADPLAIIAGSYFEDPLSPLIAVWVSR